MKGKKKTLRGKIGNVLHEFAKGRQDTQTSIDQLEELMREERNKLIDDFEEILNEAYRENFPFDTDEKVMSIVKSINKKKAKLK